MAGWLDYESRQSGLTRSSNDLLDMALDQPEKPEQPEILMILRRMRKMDVPYTDGGYEDQPYILMLELDAAVDTENEHWARIRLNQAAQAGAQNNGNTNPGALPASLRKL